MALFVGVAGFSACDDSADPTPVTLQGYGMSPSAVTVSAFDQIDFINADSGPHQIVSVDCAELSTGSIAAGDTVSVQAGQGPKTCHLEDAAVPGAAAFQVTVEILPVDAAPLAPIG